MLNYSCVSFHGNLKRFHEVVITSFFQNSVISDNVAENEKYSVVLLVAKRGTTLKAAESFAEEKTPK